MMKTLALCLLLCMGCESPTAPTPCQKEAERDRGRHKVEEPSDCDEWLDKGAAKRQRPVKPGRSRQRPVRPSYPSIIDAD